MKAIFKKERHISYFIVFLWLSFSLHLYALYFMGIKNFWEYQKEKQTEKVIEIQNIILDTVMETEKKDQKAVISDKNNINSSEIYDKNQKEDYNVVNPNVAKGLGIGGKATYIRKEGQKSEAEQSEAKGIRLAEDQSESKKQLASEGGGNPAPTLFNDKKEHVVNLYNNGRNSIATHSKEYAKYFLDMKKKVEEYYRIFFPAFQYYQGLLKDGTVIVEYSLNDQGDVVSAEVIQSLDDTADSSSLNAIVYAKNFGELPKDLKGKGNVKVRFHFIFISQ